MDRNTNRCANSEALARHEREMEANERRHDERIECLKSDMSDSISYLSSIVDDNPDIRDELKEFIEDMI